MGASHNHGQMVTHAHILLVGFVVSFLYGLVHKLWLHQPSRGLANAQFLLHQFGAILMFVGLFMLYGGFVPEPTIGPVLGISSVIVLLAALLMIVLVLKFSAESKTA